MSDLIIRQAAIDIFDDYNISVEDGELEAYSRDRKRLCELPSAQPEPCEDAVSRRRLLSDLKELTAAWGKYPVMEEQIKGVETAIGYVETIPSAQPEQRWIPCSERLPEDDEVVLVSDGVDYAVAFWRSDADAWDDPLHGWLDSFEFNVKAWMPLPDPYQEEGDK